MSRRWGADRLLSLAEAALAVDGVDGVEVLLERRDDALTRFAESRIHQNVARVDGTARVRVVVDGARVGVAATNALSPDAVRAAAESAREVARLTPPDPTFAGLTPPPQGGYPDVGVDDEETASCPPEERAARVAALLAPLPADAVGAGTVETGGREVAIANSLGLRGWSASTRAAASLLASGPDSTGWAEDGASRLADLDASRLGRVAAAKVEDGRGPREVAAGDYPVVLEPQAVAELVQWLAFVTFNGKAVLEGRSAFSGHLGEQVCSPLVTVTDEPHSPLLPDAAPFDAEGTPTAASTAFIDAGTAAGAAHDRATAARAGTTSTGHALPQPSAYGAIPSHLVLQPGDASRDDLVGGLARGLLVTRFHYTNVVHPVLTTITGMTRDGTFLVEDGRVVGGVRNLRFTQSALGALAAVEAVGRDSEVASSLFFGAARVPALRLSRFTFTSTTGY